MRPKGEHFHLHFEDVASRLSRTYVMISREDSRNFMSRIRHLAAWSNGQPLTRSNGSLVRTTCRRLPTVWSWYSMRRSYIVRGQSVYLETRGDQAEPDDDLDEVGWSAREFLTQVAFTADCSLNQTVYKSRTGDVCIPFEIFY